MTFSLVNGVPAAQLSIHDRGLAFGDGLFESQFCRPGHIPLLEHHLNRLKHGCDVLSMPYPKALIETSLAQAEVYLASQKISSNTAFKSKLLVTRGQQGAGYRPNKVEAEDMNVLLSLTAFERQQQEEVAGVSLQLSTKALSANKMLVGLKHTNRLDYILAAQTVNDASKIPAMSDSAGHIIEALHHNLFFVYKDQLCTPSLSDCGVEGVAKTWVKHHHNTGLVYTETCVTPQKLCQASEVFICNSVRGIWPVTGFSYGDQQHEWQAGSVTRSIQQALNTVLWGRR